MKISLQASGSFKNTEQFLGKLSKLQIQQIATAKAQVGVKALQSATPKESGLAASSWGYTVKSGGSSVEITWTNTNTENGFPVAIMLQYGYGTGTGGYVAGRDYINPAMRPVFDKIADDVWKAVMKA